jgi:hypothetical protein
MQVAAAAACLQQAGQGREAQAAAVRVLLQLRLLLQEL